MQSSLLKKYQQTMRDQGLMAVSNSLGLSTILVEILLFACLIFAISQVDAWGVVYWLLEIFGGVLIFHWFVVVHECGHKTLFSKKLWNTLFGHLASIVCLIPYVPWRNVHLQHHRWVGVIDKDPTQKDLLKLNNASEVQNKLFRIVWKLWIPIPFIKFIFEVFWGYALERRKNGDNRNSQLAFLSCLVCAFPHIAIITIFGISTWAYFYIPMLIVFYVLIENINLPQHSGLFPYLSETHPEPIPFAEQDAITRSTYLPDYLSVCLTLNFNRHTEHHLFPAAPWYSLNKVRKCLVERGYQHPHEVKFMAFMCEIRSQDPLTIYRDALPQSIESQP